MIDPYEDDEVIYPKMLKRDEVKIDAMEKALHEEVFHDLLKEILARVDSGELSGDAVLTRTVEALEWKLRDMECMLRDRERRYQSLRRFCNRMLNEHYPAELGRYSHV